MSKNKFDLDSTYIDSDKIDVLQCRRLPARISILQAGVILGFQEYELIMLVRLGKLKCLGAPVKTFEKAFQLSVHPEACDRHEVVGQVNRAPREGDQGEKSIGIATEYRGFHSGSAAIKPSNQTNRGAR